jgi:V8-like Glu-specific endopeptidase
MSETEDPDQPEGYSEDVPEADIDAYWTPERMRDATPLPIERPEHSPGLPDRSDPPPPPIIIPPNLPDSLNLAATAAADPVQNPKQWPYSAIGKLFMTFKNKDFVGSGFAVTGSKSVLMTAGHCVYSDSLGGWANRVIFCPSYVNGETPTRFFNVRVIASRGWINNHDYNYDFGAVVVSGDMYTNRGNLGLTFNQPYYSGRWTSVGYPDDPPYPGHTMYQTTGDYARWSSWTVAMNNNNMTRGCSGGPWQLAGQPGMINGLNSYRFANEPDYMYTPYFSTAAHAIWWCAVTGGHC